VPVLLDKRKPKIAARSDGIIISRTFSALLVSVLSVIAVDSI
jgi:hypothetical protein